MMNTRYSLVRPKLRYLLIRGDTTLRQAMGPSYRCTEGEIFISAGKESSTVYLLEAGWVMRSRRAPTGRWQIIGMFLPGDLIGSENMLLKHQPDTVECLTEVHIRAIDQERLLEIIGKNHAVNMRIMFEFTEDKRRLHNWGMALSKGRADERIAALFLDFHRRLHRAGLANDNGFWMPLKQSEIADHLGLSPEHVNRTLRRLRTSGIVTVQNRVVAIDSMIRLSQLAAPLLDTDKHEESISGRWPNVDQQHGLAFMPQNS